jgi:1-deoxy-D-xylulose-5-phosphate reductoisomerase
MRSLTILGATGSIGASTLDLVRRNRDAFRIVALTGHSNVAVLAALAIEFAAEFAVVGDEALLPDLRAALAGTGIASAGGAGALIEAAQRPADLTVAAIVGCAGLAPTMAAIEQGRTVALANKEALVSAGGVMTRAVAHYGTTLLPVDSEHNAIFQCLAGNDVAHVRWVTLTASGGPFRDWPIERLQHATPAEAVRHPNWSMGAKISVDSATMMNKGLEFIEAWHLFPVGTERLRVIVHPQSIIHSMVEYRDGTTLAQLGPSDMRVPIASALAWPARMATPCEPLDLAAIGTLTFRAPDEVRFPATRLARDAVEAGGAAAAVMNAANEIAVAAFLGGQIGFTQIVQCCQDVLACGLPSPPQSLEEVIAVDHEARVRARANLARTKVWSL